MSIRPLVTVALVAALATPVTAQSAPLVLQSDYGLLDGAVAAMKGVAFGVSRDLRVFDLTHDIPQYNIWEAAYRLKQTARYWPPGTVFVSIVDPGVGTERKSVVLRTKSGHYFVSPDNGSLTLVAEELGIDQVREIDESVNRLPGSEASYTFHGRDVYAYTGARLAAGIIRFDQVGPLRDSIVSIPYQHARIADGRAMGNIPILDARYGNVWTNIDRETFDKLGGQIGSVYHVQIRNGKHVSFDGDVPYVRSFGDVPVGKPLLYLNSLLDIAVAINQRSFAAAHHIGSGPTWSFSVWKAR